MTTKSEAAKAPDETPAAPVVVAVVPTDTSPEVKKEEADSEHFYFKVDGATTRLLRRDWIGEDGLIFPTSYLPELRKFVATLK